MSTFKVSLSAAGRPRHRLASPIGTSGTVSRAQGAARQACAVPRCSSGDGRPTAGPRARRLDLGAESEQGLFIRGMPDELDGHWRAVAVHAPRDHGGRLGAAIWCEVSTSTRMRAGFRFANTPSRGEPAKYIARQPQRWLSRIFGTMCCRFFWRPTPRLNPFVGRPVVGEGSIGCTRADHGQGCLPTSIRDRLQGSRTPAGRRIRIVRHPNGRQLATGARPRCSDKSR